TSDGTSPLIGVKIGLRGKSMKLWEQLLKANAWGDFVLAAGIALLAFFFAWLVRNLVARFISHQALAAEVVRATRLWLLAPLALYAGAGALGLAGRPRGG